MTPMHARYAEYDPFAWIYNRHWGPVAIQRFLPIVEKLVLPQLPTGAHILDLCCGTGQLSHALAERGYQVTGIDGSENMIRLARINAPNANFIIEDARLFNLPKVYHAVVSTYDSLNHIMSLEQLTQVFKNVSACLLDSGLFLFDLNMEEGYKARWRGSFGIVEDDHVCVLRANFDESQTVAQVSITIFRKGGDVWHRSDLTLEERCYSEQEIRSALEAAGFINIQLYDAQKDLGWSGEIGRTFFLARKFG